MAASNLSAPTFDLDTYAANYDGPLLPLRLAHIAVHCPSLSRQALSLALKAAHKGKDAQLYATLCNHAGSMGAQDLLDADAEEWMTRQEEANRRELSRLESELRGYKNNLIRESIRMGQEDLATHHLLTGGPLPDPSNPQSVSTTGYNAAYQAFGKMRDHCTTPLHIASMTMRLIYTSLLQAVQAQQWGHAATTHWNAVLANANRLRSVGVKEYAAPLGIPPDPQPAAMDFSALPLPPVGSVLAPMLEKSRISNKPQEEQSRLTPLAYAASGIASVGLGEYRQANSSFLACSPEYNTLGQVQGMDFSKTVATANDIAILGGLCALATMSREDLQSRVLLSSTTSQGSTGAGGFRAFLELEPHMRKAISLYTTAKYQACLATLRHYYSDWSLDVFLGAKTAIGGSHVDALLGRIREKSITAYFSSFSEVSLASLAETFPPPNTNPGQELMAMENEIMIMIQSGTLNGRLDVVNGLVISPPRHVRQETHAEAKAAAEEVERTLLLRLHKVNMTQAGFTIEGPKGKGKGFQMAGGWDSGNGGS